MQVATLKTPLKTGLRTSLGTTKLFLFVLLTNTTTGLGKATSLNHLSKSVLLTPLQWIFIKMLLKCRLSNQIGFKKNIAFQYCNILGLELGETSKLVWDLKAAGEWVKSLDLILGTGQQVSQGNTLLNMTSWTVPGWEKRAQAALKSTWNY